MKHNLRSELNRNEYNEYYNGKIDSTDYTKIIESSSEIEFYDEKNNYVGFISYCFYLDVNNIKFAYLENIKNVSEKRRKGIGTTMFNHFISFIKQEGYNFLVGKLSYHNNDAARFFFRKQGCFVHDSLDLIYKSVSDQSPHKPSWVL